jgi:thiol-disulfide isomerase/thioredoxin
MKFIHINPKTKDTSEFNESIIKGKNIFVIFYLEGCGPCNATRPEWAKLENVLNKYKDNDNIVVADIDQDFLKNIKYLTSQPKGFPTIRYISHKGENSEDYEDSSDLKDDEKDRKIDSFVKWIDFKMKNPIGEMKQRGGKKGIKGKRSIKTKRTKRNRTKRNRTKKNRTKRR